MTSIAASLGIGTGIDTKALVTELTNAAGEARLARINARTASNNARISALGILKGDLDTLADGFAEAASSVAAPDGLKALMTDFVASYNALMSGVASASNAAEGGALAGESAPRELVAALRGLTLTPLAGEGAYTTLASLGVATQRDGSLKLDKAKFDTALAADPVGVAALFGTNTGIAKAFDDLRDRLEGANGALTIAGGRYDRAARSLSAELTKANEASTELADRLTRSFAGMDRQVAALKAVQSYVEQQIAAWNAAK